MGTTSDSAAPSEGLRGRHVGQVRSEPDIVGTSGGKDADDNEEEKDKKTIGRTPDGTRKFLAAGICGRQA